MSPASKQFDTEAGGTGLTYGQLAELAPGERYAILIATIRTLREKIQPLSEQLEECERILRREIIESGGDRALGNDGEVAKLEKTYTYEYDFEVLAELQQYLPPEQYDRVVLVVPAHTVVVPTQVKIDKKVLNQVALMGGKIKDIATRGAKQRIRWGALTIGRL
jgi:hypothetical protein